MPTLLKFEKQGCNPCVMVQNFLDDKCIEVEKHDAFANPELSSHYNIGSLPTLILLDDNGEEVRRSIGFKPDEIEEMIAVL